MSICSESVFFEASVSDFDVEKIEPELSLDGSQLHGQTVCRKLDDVQLKNSNHQLGVLGMVPLSFLSKQKRDFINQLVLFKVYASLNLSAIILNWKLSLTVKNILISTINHVSCDILYEHFYSNR